MSAFNPEPPKRLIGWRSAYGLPVVLLLLHVTVAWLGRAPGLLTRQDDSRYLGLAEALLQGHYRDTMWPGAPLHHMYPPGFPAMLAVWTRVGGDTFDWIVCLHILMSAVTIALVFEVARRRFPGDVALATLCVLSITPKLLEYAGQIVSEGAMGFMIVIAVWASAVLAPGTRRTAIMLAAGLLAPTMRAAGVAIPLAVAVSLGTERRWRQCVLAFALAAAVVGPLMWWTLNDPTDVAGSSYAADLSLTPQKAVGPIQRLQERVTGNAVFYVTRGIPTVMSVPVLPDTIVDNLIWTGVLFGGLGVGAWVAWRSARLAVVSLGSVAGLLLLWPWQVTRYLVPVLPLLVPICLLGVWTIGRSLSDRVARLSLWGVSGLLLLQGLVTGEARVADVGGCRRGSDFPDPKCVSPQQRGFFDAAHFIRDSLPVSAVIVSAKSEPLHYYTKRTTVPYQKYAGQRAEAVVAKLQEVGAEYVLLTDLHVSERRRLAPLLRATCGSIVLVRQFSTTAMLFEIPRGFAEMTPSTATPGSSCRALDAYDGAVDHAETSDSVGVQR